MGYENQRRIIVERRLNFWAFELAVGRGQEAHLVQDKVADSAVTQVCRTVAIMSNQL